MKLFFKANNLKELESKRLILLETVNTHFDRYEDQFLDDRIWTYLYEKEIVEKGYRNWVQKVMKLSSQNVDKLFSIYSKQYDEIVGLIRLHNISKKHCKAEIITIIFYNRQGQGFGGLVNLILYCLINMLVRNLRFSCRFPLK